MAYPVQFARAYPPSMRQVQSAMTPLKMGPASEPALFKGATTANPPARPARATGKGKKKGKSNLFYGG